MMCIVTRYVVWEAEEWEYVVTVYCNQWWQWALLMYYCVVLERRRHCNHYCDRAMSKPIDLCIEGKKPSVIRWYWSIIGDSDTSDCSIPWKVVWLTEEGGGTDYIVSGRNEEVQPMKVIVMRWPAVQYRIYIDILVWYYWYYWRDYWPVLGVHCVHYAAEPISWLVTLLLHYSTHCAMQYDILIWALFVVVMLFQWCYLMPVGVRWEIYIVIFLHCYWGKAYCVVIIIVTLIWKKFTMTDDHYKPENCDIICCYWPLYNDIIVILVFNMWRYCGIVPDTMCRWYDGGTERVWGYWLLLITMIQLKTFLEDMMILWPYSIEIREKGDITALIVLTVVMYWGDLIVVPDGEWQSVF